jgi:uncharacterized membrane protein (DUF4010 family)
MASGMMYLRLAALLGIFNPALLGILGPSFAVLAAAGLLGGWLWSRRPDPNTSAIRREFQPKNPLEFRAAFLFGLLFLTMIIATQYAVTYLGQAGLYGLAAVMGVVDVDPFILGITQSTGGATPLAVSSGAILIAAASNNLVKGIYAYTWSDRKTGVQSLSLLAVLAVLGLAPLLWLAR